jgi:hypothetical protein
VQQAADLLADGRAAGLARVQDIDTGSVEARGKRSRGCRFAGAFAAFEDDEDGASPRRTAGF